MTTPPEEHPDQRPPQQPPDQRPDQQPPQQHDQHAGRQAESRPERISPLVSLLGLERHVEGGWFKETWRTTGESTPPGYPGPRAYATGIHFLLHPGERSRWHRVRSDELWLWHRGGPLRLHFGGTGGTPSHERTLMLGPSVESGERPQLLVPAGTWQSADPGGAEPVLVSCVVAPGFHYDDFELKEDEEEENEEE